jgi:hypothetical protein
MYNNPKENPDQPHRSIQHEGYERVSPLWSSWSYDCYRNLDVIIKKNMIGFGGSFDVTSVEVR